MTESGISILVPTYARAAWLQEALWCAVHQSVATRVIVLNDCPRQHLRCEHPLVTIVNLPERIPTLGEKRNALLQLAKTEWIVWLDDDDWLLPWYVEDLLPVTQAPFDTVLTTRCWHAIGGNDDGCVHWSRNTAVQPMAVRLQAVRDIGGYPALDAGEDRNFLARMLARGRICSLATVSGYCYRWDNGIFHVSGSGDPLAGGALGQDAEIRLNQGREPSGRVIISPSLRHGYFKNFPERKRLNSYRSRMSSGAGESSERRLAFAGREIKVTFPRELEKRIAVICKDLAGGRRKDDIPTLAINRDPETGRYRLSFPGRPDKTGIVPHDLEAQLLKAMLGVFLEDYSEGFAVHAGAVARGEKAVLLPGTSGTGKSLLTAWLLGKSYQYLSDACVCLGETTLYPWRQPLALKKNDEQYLAPSISLDGQRGSVIEGTFVDLVPWRSLSRLESDERMVAPTVLLFPAFRRGADLSLEALSPAQAGLLLMATVANGRTLPAHGFPQVARLCRRVPALRMIYGAFKQLDGVLDRILTVIFDQQFSPTDLVTFLEPFNRHRHLEELAASAARALGKAAPIPTEVTRDKPLVYPIPPATLAGPRKKLTIGMATYDDYDGVYFSAQALRLYHPEIAGDIEILVVDNHPDGPCAAALKSLDSTIPGYRYCPEAGMTGTAVRDLIFREAVGDFVLCLDCHVLIVPGALRKLLDYLDAHPDCNDLLQGPLVYDDLVKLSTHMEPNWRQGMYGTWATDEHGLDSEAEPFTIALHGLGAFCCRRAAWPGFNPRFRGFGGEEGYIHEKIRQHGGTTLCLPFFRWLHRFGRPLGVPYRINWRDRIWNYLVGFQELGLDQREIREHFSKHLGADAARTLFAEIERELQSPFFFFEAIYCITLDPSADRWVQVQERLRAVGIAERVRVCRAIASPDDQQTGYALSHRRIIADARRQGLQNVLVFQDDVLLLDELPPGLDESIKELQGRDWHIFSFSGLMRGQTDPLVDGCGASKRPGGLIDTRALAYNSPVFKELLEVLPETIDTMRQWLDHIDGFDRYLAGLDTSTLDAPAISHPR